MHRRKLTPATLAVLFLLSITALAQDSFEPRIDEYLRKEMQAQQIPGVALAVVKDGKIVLARGYGIANVEHQVPVKAETIFQSGSTGKQFTATAVMMLVEEGKLSLEDRITKYFPDAPESWHDITIRHLLTHTSGMTDYPDDFDLRRDYTEDEPQPPPTTLRLPITRPTHQRRFSRYRMKSRSKSL
jgi:CubicO group peptidase (beta-lactamase class C family)